MRTEVWSTYGGWSYLPDYPTTADLDRGEIFKLVDQPNDDLLVNLKYVAPVESGVRGHQCDECGRKFIDPFTLVTHQKKDDCMDSQAGGAQGMRKRDLARMLDRDINQIKFADVRSHVVDTRVDKI